MKIDTFLHFSKDSVRQRCDEKGRDLLGRGAGRDFVAALRLLVPVREQSAAAGGPEGSFSRAGGRRKASFPAGPSVHEKCRTLRYGTCLAADCIARRGRDSNSWYALDVRRFSKPVVSATHPPLQSTLRSPNPEVSG